MKKEVLIFVFLVLLLVCGGCKKAREEPTAVTGITPGGAVTGTKGITMRFAKNLPPNRIYDTQPLDIVVELNNKGAYDIAGPADCMLHLSGYDETILPGIDKDQDCGFLEGVSVYNPDGGSTTKEFRTDTIYLPEGVDVYEPTFMLTVCYRYRTVANPIVCIDPNYYQITPQQRACAVKDVMLPRGQGAPVSVDRVDVDMMQGKVRFKIYVSNKGGVEIKPEKRGIFRKKKIAPRRLGVVLSPDVAVSRCPMDLEYEDYNIIRYNVEMTGSYPIECKPQIDGEYKLRLIDNKGVIYCIFPVSGNEAYQTPLKITLDYVYMDAISKKVEILRTP